MSPVSEQVNSFVLFEDISMVFEIGRHDWFKIACNVPPIVGSEVGRRMKSVIVLRSQVNHAKHHFVSSFLARVNDTLYHCNSFVLISIFLVHLISEKKLIKPIVMPFQAVDCTFQRVYFSKT